MTKPPLFFIHGMWNTPHVWHWYAERYAARGHGVSTPALPYHDDPSACVAPAPALGTIGLGDYVDALAEKAAALDAPPVLVGHSMGGLLAQLLAVRRRPAGLVLLAPGPSASSPALGLAPIRTTLGVVGRWAWWRRPTKVDRPRARWGIFNEVPSDVAEEELDAMVWDSGRALFQMALPWLDGGHAARVDHERLDMPALVVVGDRDRITPVGVARSTARRLRGRVDYREIAGAGHWLFHDPVRGLVASYIDQFLADLPEAAAPTD